MPEPNFDIQPAERPKSSDNPKDKGASSARSISAASVQDLPPILRRRQTRTNYDSRFRTIDTTPLRPSWRPGQEPGIDPSKPNGGRSQAPMLHQQCQITVVNYSSDEMVMHEFNNEQFIEFLQKPQESWIKCSWINVTGLSWDVIQSIGKHKRLHKLAIEDLIGGKGLTKTEWYLDHAYMAMTLLKLVSLKEEIDDPDDSDEEKNTWTPFDPSNGFIAGHTSGETQPPAITIRKGQTSPWTRMTRKLFPKRAKQEREKDLIFEYGQSLRRYLGGVNNEWTTYMEEHSPLTSKRLAVAAEQVSIFLTAGILYP
ncbi:uncharacterized protein LY89DRAFT_575344 [Mollisia scopiformis]|uniref:Uncharacterized protein n=1 Tax=Mollisia scopiformis TaxID=149040 RepID=A0A194XQU7_MOLSC|nr:uncharacterized protein LY89DRAFT_575344 [Mollisia scopiformis]KUJ22553.1 hypothetical protein LY89DRAFT_575344 [Mollisia scopiformis]